MPEPIPQAARTQNVRASEFCRYCGNEGQVPVGTHSYRTLSGVVESEEWGPCPFCEVGFEIEFQKGSPWGEAGYWKGREPIDIPRLFQPQGAFAPKSVDELIATTVNPEERERMERLLRPRAPEIEEDAAVEETLEKTADGKCDDCGDSAPRWVFGEFLLCHACINVRRGIA